MRTVLVTLAALAPVAALTLRAEDPLPATRADHRTASNNMKQIALTFHNYAATYGDKLPGDIADKDGKPLLSWRVAILPYIEEDKLYKQFNMDEPWDSDTNKKLIEKMPKIYTPIRAKAKAGETFLQRFAGPGTLLDPKVKYTIANIPDGTSNTALVVEAGEPVVWSKPADLPFDEKKALPKLGAHFDGAFYVARGDGSVIRVKKDYDAAEMKKFIMPADGNVIDFDKLTK